jgi:hypothetical protein
MRTFPNKCQNCWESLTLFSGTGGAICSAAKVRAHRSLPIPEEPTWNWAQLSPMVPIIEDPWSSSSAVFPLSFVSNAS